MSTHNICFCGEIRKVLTNFGKKKKQKKNLIWSYVGLCIIITKTCLYNFDPLKPHFYIVWGLQGYTLFFLFLLENINCRYSLEPPHQGSSNEYLQSMF